MQLRKIKTGLNSCQRQQSHGARAFAQGGRQVSFDMTTCHLAVRFKTQKPHLFIGGFVLGRFCSSAGHRRFHCFG